MTPKLKLVYFNIRGLAEPARLMLAYAKVKYEDVRIPMDDDGNPGDEWKALKPTTPMGQVPILYIDDEVICQSSAIYRFIARECGLLGKSNMEMAKADMMDGCMSDGFEPLMPWFKAVHTNPGSPENDKLLATIKTESMKPWAEKLGALVAKSGGEWVAGKHITYADFGLAAVIRTFVDVPFNFKDIIPANLQDHCKKVEALPGVREWIATRPKTFH